LSRKRGKGSQDVLSSLGKEFRRLPTRESKERAGGRDRIAEIVGKGKTGSERSTGEEKTSICHAEGVSAKLPCPVEIFLAIPEGRGRRLLLRSWEGRKTQQKRKGVRKRCHQKGILPVESSINQHGSRRVLGREGKKGHWSVS